MSLFSKILTCLRTEVILGCCYFQNIPAWHLVCTLCVYRYVVTLSISRQNDGAADDVVLTESGDSTSHQSHMSKIRAS